MGPFQYDNPLMAALVRIANMMIVSFFWAVCCLPVVTILPATAALFHTTAKVIRGNGNGVVRVFFTSLKGSLKKGIPLSLIFAGTGALLFFALWYGWQMQRQNYFGVVYFIIGCVIVFFWGMMLLHLPFALSRFEGGVSMYLRMALYFANKNILKSLLRVLLLAVVALLVDFYPIALLLLPGLYMDLICGGVEKQLRAFMEENGLSEETEEVAGETAGSGSPAATPSLDMARLYDEPEEEDEKHEGDEA